MIALVFLLFAQFTVPSHSGAVASAPAPVDCGSTLPATDSFAGSGALCSAWTQTTAANYVALVRSSGLAVPTSAVSQAMASYTGATFATDHQTVQATIVWHSGNYTSLCINMTTAGNGTCIIPNLSAVYGLANGSGTGALASGCNVTSGHVIKMASLSGTVTVTDVTTSTTLCSFSGYATTGGSPAINVDTRGAAGDSIANVTVD